ncbi:MAG: hypothetical protein LUO94_03845 [Methylococcaceae bacterium]|nr:hypothetical protein [Methylococcaceae bacterium]
MKIITRMLLLASHFTIPRTAFLAFGLTDKHGIRSEAYARILTGISVFLKIKASRDVPLQWGGNFHWNTLF